MNFLAHFVLSGNNSDLLLGNFIGDVVKGKQYEQYTPNVAKGILLHRFIDDFTDKHPVFRQGTARLHEAYGKFAPVILDVFYDHFLAANWDEHMSVPKKKFIVKCYSSLLERQEQMPEINRLIINKMSSEDWLGSYHEINGIRLILERMSRRTTFTNNMADAYKELERNYALYAKEFNLFFPEIQIQVQQRIAVLLTMGGL